MNHFQPDYTQLQIALRGGKPERVPLFELAVSPVIKALFLGRHVQTIPDDIEFAIAAGYDYLKVSPKFDMIPTEVAPVEGKRTTAIAGSDAERSWHASGKGIITNMDEFEQFPWVELSTVDYSQLDQAQKQMPEGMGMVAQYGDIFTWVWDLMGFETFSFALIDNVDLIAAMFEKVGSLVYQLFETMASYDRVCALFYSDDIAINTGLFVSPAVYKTYLFPWVTKIGELCRTIDVPFIYHSDGQLWDVFGDLAMCGVNAIHPIEPQAMDIHEVKQKLGNQFGLCGNVDVDLLARGNPEQIRAITKELLRNIAPAGGYCLGSGNSVPEYANIDNYRVMIETVHQFGNYPIAL